MKKNYFQSFKHTHTHTHTHTCTHARTHMLCCISTDVVYQLYNLHDKTMPSSNTVEEVYGGDDPDATLDLTEPYIDELGRGEGEEDGERELGGGDSIERTESVVVGMKRRATEVCTCAHLYHHILESHSVCVCTVLKCVVSRLCLFIFPHYLF